MDNALVNLAAIVGLLIFCISLIPAVLYFGTAKAEAKGDSKD